MILGFTLGVRPTLLDGCASYTDHWGKILRGRPPALLEAAGHAQKAVDHLMAYSRAVETPEETALAA